MSNSFSALNEKKKRLIEDDEEDVKIVLELIADNSTELVGEPIVGPRFLKSSPVFTSVLEVPTWRRLRLGHEDDPGNPNMVMALAGNKTDMEEKRKVTADIMHSIVTSNWCSSNGEYAFQFLFGAEFQSFKNIFDNNIDHLKEQLDNEELHNRNFCHIKRKYFSRYAHYTPQSLKETILSYLNSIKKMIGERACHEEELRITKKYVKDKQENEMEKQETMIQKSECNSPGDNSDAKREIQEMKENCSKTFQELTKVVLVLNPRVLFANENEFAFEVLFGEDYDSFAYKFYYNLARLENQMSRVEYHEGNSKKYLIELRKHCKAFLMNENPKSLDLSMFSYYLEVFQKYTLHDIKSTKDMLVRYLNAIEKEIDARAHHEEELARVYDSRVEGPDIRLSNDTKPLHEVQSTVLYNMNDRQHAEQPKFIKEGKLQNNFSKLEAQRIAFEIALQHKYQENNSLKTLQKENENFLASLQIENAHLKQTYKYLYESVQRSNVESNQCDEVKVKVNFDEIETNNIELEHRVSSLLKENEHLKLV
ncbi:hypothetical protein Tco_1235870 [Tanacetum coccineum]